MVKKLIAEIDKQPGIDKAQILIETRILTVDENFLKAIQAHKDAQILISPRVTVWDGEKAEMFIGQETAFVLGYSEPK